MWLKFVCASVNVAGAWGRGRGEAQEIERQDLKDRAGLCCWGTTDQAANFEFYCVGRGNIKGA